MKICVIGNSHGAALYSAYKKHEIPCGKHFDFFVKPGRNEPDLELVGKTFRLRGSVSTLRTTIESASGGILNLDGYDAVVVSALALSAARNEHLTSGEHPLGILGSLAWPVQAMSSQVEYVSESLLLDALVDLIERTAVGRLVAQLNSMLDIPIIVQPAPFPAIAFLHDEKSLLRTFYGEGFMQVWKSYSELLVRAFKLFSGSFSKNVSLLSYPPDSISEFGVTRREFGRSGDPWHMNDKYGSLVLGQVLQELGTTG